ncbi:MAG: hypothetical protein Q9180_000666 [Flavoplaca navasiana]
MLASGAKTYKGFQQVATKLAARDMYGAPLKNERLRYRPLSDVYGKESAKEINEQEVATVVNIRFAFIWGEPTEKADGDPWREGKLKVKKEDEEVDEEEWEDSERDEEDWEDEDNEGEREAEIVGGTYED